MRKFSRLAQRLFNAPLMLRPEKAEMLCAALVDRLGIANLDRLDGTSMGVLELRQQAGDATVAPRRDEKGFYVSGDIAIVPVDGTLVHKLGGVDPYSGMVGFDQILTMVRAARADDTINGIMVDQDSPGGETAGCFEAAKEIYQGSARFGGKPILAFANEMSCSAAYCLAAACDHVATTETGVVGSIGVWTMLVDMTKALDKDGVQVRMIRAGDRKARGGPYEAADEETVSKIQGWVDDTREMFVNAIATFREIDRDMVDAQQGDWFAGSEALKQKLVDVIDTPSAILDQLRVAAAHYRASR